MKKLIITVVSLLLVVSVISTCAFALTPNYTVSSSYKNSIYHKNLLDVKLSGNMAKDIAAVALSQVGYHESGSNSNLSGSGSSGGNHTEYGYWFGKQDNWCAIFLSWCAHQSGIPTSIMKKNAIASGTTCQFGEKKYSFGSRAPQVGDILYVQNDSDSAADHVGLVYKVDDTYIYAVEGNFGNAVGTIKYYRSSGKQTYYSSTRILFYGVPAYESNSTTTTTKPTTTKPTIQADKKGDVNFDTFVNSKDALLILEYSVGKRTLASDQKKAADVNSDGLIDSKDALFVLQRATGM